MEVFGQPSGSVAQGNNAYLALETQAVLFREGHCSFWLFIGFVDNKNMDSEYTYLLKSTENRQSNYEKVDP